MAKTSSGKKSTRTNAKQAAVETKLTTKPRKAKKQSTKPTEKPRKTKASASKPSKVKPRKPTAPKAKPRKTGSKPKLITASVKKRAPKRTTAKDLKGTQKETLEELLSLPGTDERRILTIDIGGSKVKMLTNGELEPRKERSGRELTPLKLIELINQMTSDWNYDAITIGIPCRVGPNGPLTEPFNLGPGWVGFDYASAFGKPVKILNDAAMQAVGSYEGGRMLFLGFGTGLGSTLILDGTIIPLELGDLRFDARHTVGEVVGKRGMKAVGLKKWRAATRDVITHCLRAFQVDYVMVGGGNAKYIRELPGGARQGHNQTAFRGGYRVWGVNPLSAQDAESVVKIGDWKLV